MRDDWKICPFCKHKLYIPVWMECCEYCSAYMEEESKELEHEQNTKD